MAFTHSFDWSGAGGHDDRRPGITCYRGDWGATPTLVAAPDSPPGQTWNWNRQLVCDYLTTLAVEARDRRCHHLTGLDFPFSFPWVACGGTFPGGIGNRVGFWQHVHQTIWPNGAAQDFVDHFPALFAQNGLLGAAYVNHLRCTEKAAQAMGAPALGVFNLRGVSPGKGSLCGIGVLQELMGRCERQRLPLMVWPFLVLMADGAVHPIDILQPMQRVPNGCLILVETYPKVYWVASGQQLRNCGAAATWAAMQHQFGNAAPPAVVPGTEDQADALVAWYGLTGVVDAAAVLAPTDPMCDCQAINAAVIAEEGWIHGV